MNKNETKIYVAHNGCLNIGYDVNILIEALRGKGYQITSDADKSTEIIFAGCGSRSIWVNEAIGMIKKLTKNNFNKKIIFTGCAPQIEKEKILNELKHYNILLINLNELESYYGIENFNVIDYNLSQNENTDFIGKNPLHKLSPKKIKVLNELKKLDNKFNTSLASYYKKTTRGFIFYHESDRLEYITISRGCPYSCSYCAIPRGRGPYSSVPKDIIIYKVNTALKNGIKRIMFVGDEIGNYGLDTGDSNLIDLIDSVLNLDSELTVGIRYIEPSPFLKYFENFKDYCKSNKIFLLHIPLQHGSQRILKLMNRNYNISEVRNRVMEIKNVSDTIIYSNFMVGFPSETIKDFKETIKLIKDLDVPISSVVTFSERPNTPAALIGVKINSNEKSRRAEIARNSILKIKLEKFRKLLEKVPNKKKLKILKLIKGAEKPFSDSSYD